MSQIGKKYEPCSIMTHIKELLLSTKIYRSAEVILFICWTAAVQQDAVSQQRQQQLAVFPLPRRHGNAHAGKQL